MFRCCHAHSCQRHELTVTPASLLETVLPSTVIANEITLCHGDGTIKPKSYSTGYHIGGLYTWMLLPTQWQFSSVAQNSQSKNLESSLDQASTEVPASPVPPSGRRGCKNNSGSCIPSAAQSSTSTVSSSCSLTSVGPAEAGCITPNCDSFVFFCSMLCFLHLILRFWNQTFT